jgi:PAXNEB protein
MFVEEDLHGGYSKMLLKYWLAEGVVSGHEIFVASADVDPSEILTVSYFECCNWGTGPVHCVT